jgi:hypothetical protein
MSVEQVSFTPSSESSSSFLDVSLSSPSSTLSDLQRPFQLDMSVLETIPRASQQITAPLPSISHHYVSLADYLGSNGARQNKTANTSQLVTFHAPTSYIHHQTRIGETEKTQTIPTLAAPATSSPFNSLDVKTSNRTHKSSASSSPSKEKNNPSSVSSEADRTLLRGAQEPHIHKDVYHKYNFEKGSLNQLRKKHQSRMTYRSYYHVNEDQSDFDLPELLYNLS